MEPSLDIARTILAGFDKHYRIFRQSAVAARGHFERREWTKLRETNRERIDLYDTRVLEAVDSVTSRHAEALDEAIWPEIKHAYIGLLYEHCQPECAETFFNSVANKVLHRRYHNNQHIFSRPAVAAEHIEAPQPTYRCYYPNVHGLRKILFQIFGDFELSVPLTDSRRCVRNLTKAIREWRGNAGKTEPNFHVQVLSSLFYRNKAAYAIGRLVNGHRRELFAIALRHDDAGGIRVDALIHDKEQLSNLLSVSHAYFMVDMEVPSSWVAFIASALPEKPRAEIYTAVGLQKQGKTLFFRDLRQHLKHSADHFIVAPGVRGMVMCVFTLPSFPFVFKVIRDSFEPPKDSNRDQVMEKYKLVKRHDRVGRMADTLEYADVALPLARFTPELLELMNRLIPSSVEFFGEHLIIKHMYIEARMIPLDMYMRQATTEKELLHGVAEFGQVLKDLAAANIFAGDLLPKNFGVNPHGRVLFYDYDEVCYLTECNFRDIPPARYPEDEMRAEPWYNVGPNDIFPEEFERFLFSDEHTRKLFRDVHGDILTAAYWNGIKAKISSGGETNLYPYPDDIRFKP